MPYIKVAIDVPVPRLFDYACAEAVPGDVGRLVRVPFGAKHTIGLIMEVTASPAIESARVRPAREIVTTAPALPQDLLQLVRFCSEYYHHPIGEVATAVLPGRSRAGAAVRKTPSRVAITAQGRAALAGGLKRSPRLAAILEALAHASADGTRALADFAPALRPVLRRAIERGWVCRIEASTCAQPSPPSASQVALTEDQRHTVAAIAGASPGYRTWLLHGITGSGKTEVYLSAMADVLARGGQVLFLVPEIGLTPQLEENIRARFPDARLVTLHSGLTESRRARNWSEAHAGEARIVLGTRSAVFAPLPQLGLIVVDEEHDSSYKQNEGVRYSARDLAIWRAHRRDVPVILGSATPALETWQRSSEGRYSLLRLTQRPNAAPLPRVELVATAGQRLEHGIAPALLAAIKDRVARAEQVLVFINRRGYAPVLLCPACAWAPSCPRCSVHTVLHKLQRQMLCHHCGHEEPIPERCMQCGNADLQPTGFGTQRIEAGLRSVLPHARVLRVDRDTIRARDAWPQMRAAINRGEVDLLVGTQLLSKGHDFAGISLVCVLNADRSLYSTDFRASEHLFAQLLQVAGRAGRGSAPGDVLIQTAFPAHPLYAAVRAHDYAAFAALLLEERRQAGLPPFVHQALLRAEAVRIDHALDFLQHAARAGAPLAAGVTIYDPAPAAMARLKGRERAQLLVQSDSRGALHRFLQRWRTALESERSSRARWALDVDPLEI